MINNYRYVFLDGNGGTVRYAIHGFDTRDPIPAITYFTDIPTGVDEEGNPFVYKLAGWFTERTGGTEVTVLDGSLANGSVIYAQWRDPNTGEIVEIPVGDEVDAMELTVTSDSVQLWTGPGSYYSKGAVLAKNTTITVTQVYTVSSVTWGKCEQGWLNLANTNYSSILASQPKEFPLDGTVNGNEVRVRTGPGVSYGILYTVNKGTRVTIYEEHYDGTYNWGKMGEEENASWICVDYVTYDTKAEPTVTSVSMLDSLDLTGSVLVATYSDGSIKAMTVNDSMTSGYSHTKLGTNTVTVTYSGKSTTFDVNIVKATVTFRNYDGTVLSSAQYAYGDTVIQPEAPAKPADENGEYQFVGWDKTVTTCDGDAVYTAVFKPVYTVTFQNYDGTVLSSERYVLGDTVTEPAAPTRPADENGEYEFVGWDKQITACEGDTVYTAVYRQNILMATVTFLNYDGTVLSSGAYAFGDTVVEPEVPTRAADESGAYEFIGWDQEVTACEGDTVYTAVFWLVGDFDRNGTVNEDDAIYLLRHLIISPEDYPLLGTADYTADGTVNEDDAIYLLRHVIISPEDYPLVSTSNE